MKYGPNCTLITKKRRRRLRNNAPPKVPIELIRPMVELVHDRGTLFNLLLTCSTFKFEAERVLYHTMKDEDRKTQMGFLKAILHNPENAAHVNVYHAPIARIKKHDALWRRLGCALRSMCNLKELVVAEFSASLLPPSQDKKSIPFSLEHFQCRVESIHDHKRLSHFLAGQPQLLKIKIDMAHDDPAYIEHFSSGTTPQLSFLRGPLESLKAFLPERRVIMLAWETESSDFDPDYLPVLSALAPCFNNLKYLSFGPPEPSVDDDTSLATIARQFKSLEYLDLVGFRSSDIEALQHIPSLKGLTISMGRGIVLFVPSSTVSNIFTSYPRLQFVAIEQLPGKRGKKVFKSWTGLQAQPSVHTITVSTFYHIFELLPI